MASFTVSMDGNVAVRNLFLYNKRFSHLTFPESSLHQNSESFTSQVQNEFEEIDDTISNLLYILDYTTNQETIKGIVEYLTEWESMYDRETEQD